MKPVVLFFFANDIEDAGNNLRQLATEARNLERAMESATDMCEFHIQKNTTAGDIRKLLGKYRDRVAIIHYAGHAESLQLMLETESGGKEGFRTETLAEYVRNQDALELVFLNGCSTEDQVAKLLDAGVPHVIATSQAIDDAAATNLSTAFYEGISSGASIDVAWREAVASTRQSVLTNPRGAWFSNAVDTVPEIVNQFPWSIRARPGIDPISNWNLPDASNNPLMGLPAISDGIDYPEKPFQHLKRFTRNEARVFFGRGNEIRKLYHDVNDAGGTPVILYYGQSGVGKSSLLDAGLIPRLERDFRVKYIRRTSWGIDQDLLHLFDNELTSQADRIAPERRSQTREGLVEQAEQFREAWLQQETAGKPLVLILDQIEEAWAQDQDADGTLEIRDLAVILRVLFRDKSRQPKGKLILVFRKEWYPEIDAALKQEKISRSGVFLKRLSEAGVNAAITLDEDARQHFGLQFEDMDLAQRIATELVADKNSPLAPTLQILLATMWNEAEKQDRADIRFSESLYLKLKSSGNQMGSFLDKQLGKVASQHREAFTMGLVHSVIKVHCSKLGTAVELSEWQRRELFGDNFDRAEKIVRTCKDCFLLTDSSSNTDDCDSATRLAHDTLAPLVIQRYYDSSRLVQRAERILALRRQSDDESPELLSGSELRTIRQARPFMRRLSEDESTVVLQSNKASRKRKMTGWSIVAGVLVAFLAIFLIADREIRKARKRADERLAQQRAERNEEIVSERARLLENVDSSTIYALSFTEFGEQRELSERAADLVKKRYPENLTVFGMAQISDPKSRSALINVALLEAFLGQPDIESLGNRLSDLRPMDLPNFQKALASIERTGTQDVVQDMNEKLQQVIEAQQIDWRTPLGVRDPANIQRIQMRAKLTWLMLLNQTPELVPATWYEPDAHAEPRTMTITALSDWYLDRKDYRDAFRQDSIGPDCLAAVCQSVYFLPPAKRSQQADNEWVQALIPRLNHPRITVRSSARAALTRMGRVNDIWLTDGFELATSGEDWFSVPYKTSKRQWNHLDFARVSMPGPDKEVWLATTETPWEILNWSLSTNRSQILRQEMQSKVNQARQDRLAAIRQEASQTRTRITSLFSNLTNSSTPVDQPAIAATASSNDPADDPTDAAREKRVTNQRLIEKYDSELQWQYAPACMAGFYDAAYCCNWLSFQYGGLHPSYKFVQQADRQREIRQSPDKGFRLPTSFEWTIAAKSMSAENFSFGNSDAQMQHFGWTREYSADQTHEIGHKLPNSFGFFDCYGNVWEWCWPSENKVGVASCMENGGVELMGGSYRDQRNGRKFIPNIPGEYRNLHLGFRLAISRRPESAEIARIIEGPGKVQRVFDAISFGLMR